jgi:uncharacterized membrane protein HdeD (DUF308 family)
MASKEATLTKDAASYWWLLLLQGIAAILIGWWLLTRPIGTTLVLVQFLGLYWLVAGVVDVIRSIVEKDSGHRVWQLFGGLIGIMAGMFVLNNPIFAGVLTPAVFLWIMAFAFIINGVVQIFLGNQEADSGERDRSWGSFFVGLFYALFGLLLLAMPLLASIATVVLSAGILGIVGGIGMMVFSFKLRKAK